MWAGTEFTVQLKVPELTCIRAQGTEIRKGPWTEDQPSAHTYSMWPKSVSTISHWHTSGLCRHPFYPRSHTLPFSRLWLISQMLAERKEWSRIPWSPPPYKGVFMNVVTLLYSGCKQGSKMPVPTANPRMKVKACFRLTGDRALHVKHPFLGGAVERGRGGLALRYLLTPWVTRLRELRVWTWLGNHWLLFSVPWNHPKHPRDLAEAHVIWARPPL